MTRTRLATALRIGTALAALAAATPLWAQEAAQPQPPAGAADQAAQNDAQAQNAEGGDIVVTARRRAETLINVPIADTVFTGAQLENSGARDITEIANTTPNVTLEASRGTNTTLSAFIRGIGQQDPVAGFEQGVGIYIDDVYLNRPQAAVLDIYDVERIEVLRGPQGTLYGRNTIGGAVKYVSRRLSDHPEFHFRGDLGNYGQTNAIVSASLPMGPVLRVGASIARLRNTGFGRNLTTGLSNYNQNVWAGRFSAEINNEDNVFVRLSADYTKDNSNPRGGHREVPGFASGTPVLTNLYDTQGGLNTPHQSIEAYGASLFGEFKLNDVFTVRSITAYRKDKTATPIDFDALPAADVDVLGLYNNSQTSQELQLLIKTGHLNGLFGAYYLSANAATPFDVRLFTTFAGLSAFTNAVVKTETMAGFGDFTYDVTDQISLSAGGRYTWDQRKANILRQNYLGGGSTLFGGAGIPFGAASTNFQGQHSWNKFTPRASISFKPTPDQNIYLSFSQGFKGGGFDPRGVGVNAPDTNHNGVADPAEVGNFLAFKPETVNSYELGYKASLLDHRAFVAMDVFRADYSDIQIPGSAACTVNGLATFCGVTTNAGKGRYQGVEFEGNAKVARGLATSGDTLTLAATLGYIDAKFRQYITNIPNVGPTDVHANRHVQNTPKWTASGTLAYDAPIADGHLNFSSTVSYKSKTYQFEIANPYLDSPAYATFDANLVYHARGDRWNIGLHAKNLTDVHYKTSGYTFMAADPVTGVLLHDAKGNLISSLGKEGVLTVFYGNPRQLFVTFGLNF
ncbi:MAG TPA: TonB-dependent receptor [Allosphingosinicella sp.]|jgi:iron complex outermembrane receptor protein|nr:TonB-dependent receptor [Allosphingosinicella sp.]